MIHILKFKNLKSYNIICILKFKILNIFNMIHILKFKNLKSYNIICILKFKILKSSIMIRILKFKNPKRYNMIRILPIQYSIWSVYTTLNFYYFMTFYVNISKTVVLEPYVTVLRKTFLH